MIPPKESVVAGSTINQIGGITDESATGSDYEIVPFAAERYTGRAVDRIVAGAAVHVVLEIEGTQVVDDVVAVTTINVISLIDNVRRLTDYRIENLKVLASINCVIAGAAVETVGADAPYRIRIMKCVGSVVASINNVVPTSAFNVVTIGVP